MTGAPSAVAVVTGAAKATELPLGHFGEREDVTNTVTFLASPATRFYVGQTLGPNTCDVML